MNPGSHAPQACILVHQPKKLPKIQGFLSKLDDDPALQGYTTKVLNTIEQIKANGKAENTIKSAFYTLRRLN